VLLPIYCNFLGGQAKTLMFVHVSPEMNALGETLSTLNFAERVSSVELGAAWANKESIEVKGLREEVRLLDIIFSSSTCRQKHKSIAGFHVDYILCNMSKMTPSHQIQP
jgi:Kinesin motor domain